MVRNVGESKHIYYTHDRLSFHLAPLVLFNMDVLLTCNLPSFLPLQASMNDFFLIHLVLFHARFCQV